MWAGASLQAEGRPGVGEVPEGGRRTASLRLRWDLSHLWKAGSLRAGSSRGLLRAVWRLKCIHILTHESLTDESHHIPHMAQL